MSVCESESSSSLGRKAEPSRKPCAHWSSALRWWPGNLTEAGGMRHCGEGWSGGLPAMPLSDGGWKRASAVVRRGSRCCRLRGQNRAAILLVASILVALPHSCSAITFPCIAPLLGPTIPSAPSREPSPARSRTPDDSEGSGWREGGGGMQGRLTIRGGDLAARTPRARSESSVDSTEDVGLFEAIGKLRLSSRVPELAVRVMARFRVNYSTKWGENVVILGSTEELGGLSNPTEAEARRAIASGKGKVMRYVADGNWEFVTVLDSAPSEITYRYALVRERGEPLVEGGARAGRLLDMDGVVRKGFGALPGGDAASVGPIQVEVRDQWRVSRHNGEDVLLRSAAFSVMHGQGQRAGIEMGKTSEPVTVLLPSTPAGQAALIKGETATHFRLSIERMRVHMGKKMAVVCEALFGAKAVPLSSSLFPAWELDIKVPQSMLPLQYRYVVIDEATGDILEQEAGAARWLGPGLGDLRPPPQDPLSGEGHYVVIVCDEASTDRWPAESASPMRAAGITTSLSKMAAGPGGFGPGEITDITRLVDLAVQSGLKAVHLESLSSPPWAPSGAGLSHAVYPCYINLKSIPSLGEAAGAAREAATDLLNGDAERVFDAKMSILRRTFDSVGKATIESDGFATFVEDEGYWLKPYALHAVLREEYGTGDTTQWDEHQRLSASQIESLSSAGGAKYVACRFWYWLQFNCHMQLKAASAHAKANGVALIISVPFASADPSDFWSRPELFRSDRLAGSPATGEIGSVGSAGGGGVPFDWDKMSKDGFAWWLGRVKRMSNYFHGLSMAQALSFFRVWELSGSAVTGLAGRQFPCNPITKDELDSSGLWDRTRLCEPYIRQHLLEKRLGKGWADVAARFMEVLPPPGEGGRYRFVPGLDTEASIKASVAVSPLNLEGKSEEEGLRALLVTLNDRCLIREDKAPDDRFYPRWRMWETDSFLELGQDWQRRLRDMHDAHFGWRQEEMYEGGGRERLRMVQCGAPNMLYIADVGHGEQGVPPNCAPKVLNELGYLASDLGAPAEGGGEAATQAVAASKMSGGYMSISGTGSGTDSASWWAGLSPEDRSGQWKRLGFSGEAPQACDDRVVTAMIKSSLCDSPSVLCLIPLVDIAGLASSGATSPPGGKARSPSGSDKDKKGFGAGAAPPPGRVSLQAVAKTGAPGAIKALVKEAKRYLE